MEKAKKFFDLSQPVYDNCPAWPTYETVTVKNEAFHERDNFNAEQIRMNSHTGTHMDAPYHFFPDGVTIDEIPVEKLQGDAILVDFRDKLSQNEGITTEMLKPYESKIQKDIIIMLNTGWGKKRGFNEEFFHNWPYLTGEAAQWLVSKEIRGITTDCMSIGGWYEGTGRPCHEALLGAGIWVLEEAFIPDELMNYDSCYLMAFPIKLRGFSGAPVRAVASI